MNQVKSTPYTIEHFGSMKYAELVDPMEKNGNSKQSCTIVAVLYQKLIFLTMKKKLAEVISVKMTV